MLPFRQHFDKRLKILKKHFVAILVIFWQALENLGKIRKKIFVTILAKFRPSVENSPAISVGAAKIGPLFPLDGLLWPGGSRPKASDRRRCGLQWWTVKQHVGPINS